MASKSFRVPGTRVQPAGGVISMFDPLLISTWARMKSPLAFCEPARFTVREDAALLVAFQFWESRLGTGPGCAGIAATGGVTISPWTLGDPVHRPASEDLLGPMKPNATRWIVGSYAFRTAFAAGARITSFPLDAPC